ncbi:MAG: PD40 domain-containing protein [Crocinitomicaceae bacterium]|nr:PD40 domain-containing protein [Crocinitomicaceae bacterium]
MNGRLPIQKIMLMLGVFFYALVSCAQMGQWDTKSKKAIKYAEAGMDAINQINPQTGYPDYETGIAYMDKAIAKDPLFSDAYLLKAEFCIQIGRVQEAIAAYKKVLEVKPTVSSTGYIYFDLALLEWSEGLYEDALKHAKIYQSYPNANPEMLIEAKWVIANCEFAVEAIKNPLPFNPINVGSGVNTADPEYFPTLTVDQQQLLFTRRVTQSNGYFQEDFFISDNLNGYWNMGEPMPKNINTPNNEGAPTFAPDGRTLIFVGCVDERYGYGEGRRGYGSCDLFITQKVGNTWYDPINLPGGVNTQNWETQPSLSADGKTLYFIRGPIRGSGAKNIRNGDIYVSYLQDDGSWSEAKKLPDNINTPKSESSVLIHPDGKTLYFASNGHIGMGGYDLYMTTLQPDGTWSDPKNLGYPINTQHDENSLLVYADGKVAVFASDRPGGMGELDLYEFEMPEEIRPTKTIYMTGTVFDSKTNQKLRADFRLIDLETKEEVVYSYSDSKTGSFLVTLPVNKDYALFVERDGYLPYSVNFTLTVPENSDEPYHRDIPLVALNSVGDEITLENVFFDLDSYNLRPESYIELDKLAQYLTDNPGLKIELQGHTDTQGDDKHNLELSQNRAKAVYDYLISKGIAKERLTYKGFGETQPVITDEEIAKLTTDKEIKAAHQKNRRTVYKIVAI